MKKLSNILRILAVILGVYPIPTDKARRTTFRSKRRGLALFLLRLRFAPYLPSSVLGRLMKVGGIPLIAGGADPYVRQARGVFTALIGSTAVKAGDLMYFDGTDWELADADDNTKAAEAIAVNSYATGETGPLCIGCLIVDTDAPYTQGDQYFLSTTAGAITATRPTAANNLVQTVGFGLSTSVLRAEITMEREHMYYVHPAGGTDVGAIFQLDSGNYIGHTTNAQNEVVGCTFMVPQNCVALEIAFVWLAAENSVGTPTFDLTVSGAIDGEQWDATTQDSTIAASADEGAAADELQKTDITTAFDAAGVWEAGNLLGMRFLKADGGTDVTFKFGVVLACRLV